MERQGLVSQFAVFAVVARGLVGSLTQTSDSKVKSFSVPL